MDFRSQLSAFQNSGGSGGSGGARGGGNPSSNNDNRNDDTRSHNRSPGRPNNNSNHNYNSTHNSSISSNRTNYGRGGSGSDYGRGGGEYGGRGRGDHVRGGGDGRDFRPSGGDYGAEGSDRRRPRPQEWSSRHQEPPSARRRLIAPDPDALGDLRGYGYRIPKGFPDPPTPKEMAKKPKHVALLAITVDDLPYEHIWKGWCQTLSKTLTEQDGVDEYFVSLVCHAKYPKNVRSDWLRQRLITHPPKPGRGNSYMDPEFLTRIPSWGSVEITRAMLDVLQDGLKIGNCTEADKRFAASRFLIRTPPSFDADCASAAAIADTEGGNAGRSDDIPAVDHFLYISESCLPVVTAREFFERIQNTESWVNARHRKQEDTPKNKYEDDQFAGINRRIPGQYRWKGDQWVLLSRRHASKIIDLDRPHISPKHQLWQSFRDINASDEMYFPTALALLGYLRFTSDGEDTQRPRDPNASHPQATDNGGDKGGGPSSDASPPASKNGCILLKPVTYTDWTQGMKNPATFSHGVTDLKRVGRVARDKGCLVARKFAPCIAVPGVPKWEQKITGEISITEWEAAIRELQNIEDAEKAAKPEGKKPDPSHNGATVGPNKEENSNDGDCAYEINDHTAKSMLQPTAPKGVNGEDDKEEEDNEEETS